MPLENTVTRLLQPYILRWLAETDSKTLGWVRNAINVDQVSSHSRASAQGLAHEANMESYAALCTSQFDAEQAIEGDGHSHSIDDLIDSCKGAVKFVTDLDWPEETENAVFLTKLSATISKAIEQYASAIEGLFIMETAPVRRQADNERDERSSAWLVRAKALYQEKKLEAFQFQPTVSGMVFFLLRARSARIWID